uniref:(California timema) hypothetical protein n=1 Tax=Timema californicum TaxID=61474 RepID=A0A7R9PBH5_TIMCA|nr:unnamed protein product [Timema californicum]
MSKYTSTPQPIHLNSSTNTPQLLDQYTSTPQPIHLNSSTNTPQLLYEEEPRTPSAVTPPAPKLTAGSRLSSLDSGATSESDETYKAPPSARTVSSPPRTLVAASQGQTSSKLDAPAVVRYERDELLDLCTQAIAHGNYREYDRLVKHFPDMMPKVAGE